MILISVISDFMVVKKQFESNAGAEKYLKQVNRLHDMARLEKLRKKKPLFYSVSDKSLLDNYEKELTREIPLKIEIIDTEAAQLSNNELLNQTRKIKN